MFLSNLEIILEIKLGNFIISFFEISFNLIYIYIYIIIIFTYHVMQSSINKYMIMVKKCYRQDYEKYNKTIFFNPL